MKDNRLAAQPAILHQNVDLKDFYPRLQTKEEEVRAAAKDDEEQQQVPEKQQVATTPKIKVRQILWLVAVVFLFFFSFTGAVIVWGTNILEDTLDRSLLLLNNSESRQSFEAFLKTPATPHLKVWLFNYTNVEDFEMGRAEKLKVQETGPYVYREYSERTDVQFHDNGTLSFHDKKTYIFAPEVSNGSLDDVLTVINMPLMTMNYMARGMEFWQWVPAMGSLRLINPQPFFAKTAYQIFHGYSDTLTTIAEFKYRDVRVGLLQAKNGTSADRITMYTGELDKSKLAQITRFNGLPLMDFYNKDDCNRVDASEGSKFPPSLVRPENTLVIYHRDVCRKIPLKFQKHVKVWDDIPALRFGPPDDLFDNSEDKPENECYCTREFKSDTCFPSGVMDTSHCRKGAPVFASYPHFFGGDPVLRDVVDGLEPHREKHTNYLDIHQRVGAPVATRTRLQINILMKNVFPHPLIAKVDNKILPILWMERDCGEFPPELRQVFRFISFTLPKVVLVLQYGCPLVATITGIVLLVCIYIEVAALLRKDDDGEQVTHF